MSKLGKLLLTVFILVLVSLGLLFAVKLRLQRQLPPKTSGQTGVERLEARLNQEITALGITIKPLEVVEDSRCPADVQCIQAGTVRLKMLLVSGETNINANFTLNESVSTDTATVTLVAVEPAKRAGVTIKPEEYRFFFDVKKVEQVFCTQEAKLCPDGSGVGRVGPSCEFSPCPGN